MKASAALTAEAVDGRTSLTTLRSEPPLTVRATPEGVHLVGSAAGPLGGDELRIDVRVGPDADLVVRSAAASVVLPGPRGGSSSLTIVVDVGAGGALTWLPEPTVAARGCDHRVTTLIDLADGAELVWREELVLGRHDEAAGSILQRLRVDRGGRPLLRHDLALGPAWPTADGPAGTAGARAVGALLVVGPAAKDLEPPALDGVRATVAHLAPDAALLLALSANPRLLRGFIGGSRTRHR